MSDRVPSSRTKGAGRQWVLIFHRLLSVTKTKWLNRPVSIREALVAQGCSRLLRPAQECSGALSCSVSAAIRHQVAAAFCLRNALVLGQIRDISEFPDVVIHAWLTSAHGWHPSMQEKAITVPVWQTVQDVTRIYITAAGRALGWLDQHEV